MISFPNTTINFESFALLGKLSKISLTVTEVVTLLGISIPIVDFPGIGV